MAEDIRQKILVQELTREIKMEEPLDVDSGDHSDNEGIDAQRRILQTIVGVTECTCFLILILIQLDAH